MRRRGHLNLERTNPLFGSQATDAELKIGKALGVVGFLIWFYFDINVIPYYSFLGILHLRIENIVWFGWCTSCRFWDWLEYS